jgi:hypothetical protein
MANRKISDLTALTAPVTGDLLPIVDISEAAAADKNKKITYGTFLSSVPLGTAAAPSIAFTGDTNTGIYSPGADQLAIATGGTSRFLVTSLGRLCIGSASTDYKVDITPEAAGGALRLRGGTTQSILQFADNSASAQWGVITVNAAFTDIAHGQIVRVSTGASERWRIDSSGRQLVGTSTQQGTHLLQIQGDSAGTTGAGSIFLRRGLTDTVINGAGDVILGQIDFGSQEGGIGAKISSFRDGGTWSSTSKPSRLVFSTTADGATSPAEALRITRDGVLAYNQPTPATYAAAATLTVADLKTKIITYTGTAATLTLPTGTATEVGFGTVYTNMAFEWSVINTGAGICTIGAATAHTIVGSATVAIGASARFASRRTASLTFVSYRLN